MDICSDAEVPLGSDTASSPGVDIGVSEVETSSPGVDIVESKAEPRETAGEDESIVEESPPLVDIVSPPVVDIAFPPLVDIVSPVVDNASDAKGPAVTSDNTEL